MNTIPMLRLFNLISPALPVGAFAYSQGLEWAIEEGGVDSPEAISDWIANILRYNISHTDIPVMARMINALAAHDREMLLFWNQWSLASRETQELLDEDRQVGKAMLKVLQQHSINPQSYFDISIDGDVQPSLLLGWSLAAWHWEIDTQTAVTGFCWSWLENQITVAGKTLPLGQSQAQKILGELMPVIERSVDVGLSLTDEQMGHSLPGWTMACALHETQYSRLFRS
ncbi:urease accessory protein UreF [Hahella sp. CCB-MM4]|uniref:urease accessory protein UreF n=1 Tax=Hahella sp. (strain CCB-MM4) TaxID=1926491 RepID=UPI000B9C3BCC|nr:urease accessory UreF family protein [Hahella sp. CCB-MM4]OZG73886.1 urease accessory protein UreF [Hahella sp. CCB-MM4]